jgi:protein-S-isoprenylcysteine O-methyltransferase Ste14
VRTKRPALLVVPLVIGLLTCIFALLAHLLVVALGIPIRLHLPTGLRVAGGTVLLFGYAFMGWLYRCRKPIAILESTYITMRRAGGLAQPPDTWARTEPLILLGPQRYVRHPLYFAVVVVALGWWLLLDYTLLLLMAFFFFLWFTLVVIRFEERELRALFPEEYEAYARAVPMIVPALRPKWPKAEV